MPEMLTNDTLPVRAAQTKMYEQEPNTPIRFGGAMPISIINNNFSILH